MESPENDSTVFRPSHKPWKSIEPIPTFPPPRRLLAIYSSRKDKKPPARKLLSFRLILGLEKTAGNGAAAEKEAEFHGLPPIGQKTSDGWAQFRIESQRDQAGTDNKQNGGLKEPIAYLSGLSLDQLALSH
jgi:hypothetical protein